MHIRHLFTVLLLVFYFFPVPAHSQETPTKEETAGRPNGRLWQNLDEQKRILFLWGIDAGLQLCCDQTRAPHQGKWKYDPQCKELIARPALMYSDWAQEITAFYKEKSNIRIPIQFAYMYAVSKAQGVKPEDLSTYASELRRLWNAPWASGQ
jgi:hypothetical protein